MAQLDSIELYAFGHSLIDHRPQYEQEETTILYWMYDIATHSNEIFRTTGQYGFLPNHDNLPPKSNWTYPTVPISWDESLETFAESDLTTVLITAANFIQGTPPQDPHPVDSTTTVIQSTDTIFNWTNVQKPNMRYYIYGNWPEIPSNVFPPPQNLIDSFHNQVISGNFANWWEVYHDSIMSAQPDLEVRLIPVGQIISKLHKSDSIIPTSIPFEDLYEDNDPHGKPTTYFLAGMITYMAMYEKQIPESYMPSDTIHQAIRDSLSAINDFIWQELMNYNDENGVNRVFHGSFLPAELLAFEAHHKNLEITLSWETHIEENFYAFIIEESTNGRDFYTIGEEKGKGVSYQVEKYSFDVRKEKPGRYYYRLKLLDKDLSFTYSPIVTVRLLTESTKFGGVYPNPCFAGNLTIPYSSGKNGTAQISIFDNLGKLHFTNERDIYRGKSKIDIDINHLSNGIYYLIIESAGKIDRNKIIIQVN